MDPTLGSHRHGVIFANVNRPRPRPRSLHELPSYHVEMPLLPFDQVQNIGPWTPGPPPFPSERRVSLAAPPLSLINSSMYQAEPFERRSRSPGYASAFDVASEYGERARSTSRTPSRRHTIESPMALYGAPPIPIHGSGESSVRPVVLSHYSHDPRAGYFGLDDPRRFPGWSNPQMFPADPLRRHVPGASFRNPEDVSQSFLRPQPDFSAFDANHEAIMATIPGSRSGSRHPSRSNSPHISRVNSRSGLSNLLTAPRSYASTPLSQGEGARRGSRERRSRERIRQAEEAHREAMLQALAEADTAHQLRPALPRAESDRQIELPLLHPDLIERVARTPITPAEQTPDIRIEADPTEPTEAAVDHDQDVTMTQ